MSYLMHLSENPSFAITSSK